MSRARKGDCAGAAPGGALRTAVPAGCHPGSCPRQGPRLPGTPPQGPRQSQAAPRAASEASQLLPLPAPASGRGLPDPQPQCEGRQGSGGTSSLHQRPSTHLDGASRLRENVTPHRHGAGPRPQPRAAQTREQDRTRARDSSEGAQLRVAEPDTPALSPEGRCPSGAPAQGAGPGQARQGLGGTELNSHSLSKQVVWATAARHPLPRPAQHRAAGPRPGSWSDPEAPGTARPGASGTWEPPPDLGGRGSCSLGVDEHPSSLATAALHPAAPHSTARAPRPSGDGQACWARIARLRGAAVADGPAARGCPCRAPGPRVIGPAAWAMTSSGAAATSAPF